MPSNCQLATTTSLSLLVSQLAEMGGFNSLRDADIFCFPVCIGYDTSKFGGTKSIVISNASLLGGKNGFLGGAYILTGLLCVCLGVAFLIRNMVNPRYFITFPPH